MNCRSTIVPGGGTQQPAYRAFPEDGLDDPVSMSPTSLCISYVVDIVGGCMWYRRKEAQVHKVVGGMLRNSGGIADRT